MRGGVACVPPGGIEPPHQVSETRAASVRGGQRAVDAGAQRGIRTLLSPLPGERVRPGSPAGRANVVLSSSVVSSGSRGSNSPRQPCENRQATRPLAPSGIMSSARPESHRVDTGCSRVPRCSATSALESPPRRRGRGLVDQGGIEPPSPLCESSIFPLEDRPSRGSDGNRTRLKLIDSQPTSPDVPRAVREMKTCPRERANDRGAGGNRTLVADLPSQHSSS